MEIIHYLPEDLLAEEHSGEQENPSTRARMDASHPQLPPAQEVHMLIKSGEGKQLVGATLQTSTHPDFIASQGRERSESLSFFIYKIGWT